MLGDECDYERASISSTTWDDKPGFVVVGKGRANSIRQTNGRVRKTDKGLKILLGYILTDGRPTIESSNVYGTGASSAMGMLDVSGLLNDGTRIGVVTVNRTRNYSIIPDWWVLGVFAKYYLHTIFWQYRDPFKAVKVTETEEIPIRWNLGS